MTSLFTAAGPLHSLAAGIVVCFLLNTKRSERNERLLSFPNAVPARFARLAGEAGQSYSEASKIGLNTPRLACLDSARLAADMKRA